MAHQSLFLWDLEEFGLIGFEQTAGKGKRYWIVNTEPLHETFLTLLTQHCLLLSYWQTQHRPVDATRSMAPVLSNGGS